MRRNLTEDCGEIKVKSHLSWQEAGEIRKITIYKD